MSRRRVGVTEFKDDGRFLKESTVNNSKFINRI